MGVEEQCETTFMHHVTEMEDRATSHTVQYDDALYVHFEGWSPAQWKTHHWAVDRSKEPALVHTSHWFLQYRLKEHSGSCGITVTTFALTPLTLFVYMLHFGQTKIIHILYFLLVTESGRYVFKSEACHALVVCYHELVGHIFFVSLAILATVWTYRMSHQSLVYVSRFWSLFEMVFHCKTCPLIKGHLFKEAAKLLLV